jgi:UDPglucose 6-dehydrogenase
VGVENYKKYYPTQIEYCQTPEETLKEADLCLIFTEWPQVKALSPVVFREKMRRPIIIDGRNCFSLAAMERQGLIYNSIGRRTIVDEM